MPLIFEDLDPSTSTGADLAADTDTGCPPPPACDEDGQALVGVLDDLATAAADHPLAFIVPAAAVIFWYWLRKRRISAKPPQKV